MSLNMMTVWSVPIPCDWLILCLLLLTVLIAISKSFQSSGKWWPGTWHKFTYFWTNARSKPYLSGAAWPGRHCQTDTRQRSAVHLERVWDGQGQLLLPPAPWAFTQLATALGQSPAAQAQLKGIAMTTAHNIWIKLKLNWGDIKKW